MIIDAHCIIDADKLAANIAGDPYAATNFFYFIQTILQLALFDFIETYF